jgi:hypothetical protein
MRGDPLPAQPRSFASTSLRAEHQERSRCSPLRLATVLECSNRRPDTTSSSPCSSGPTAAAPSPPPHPLSFFLTRRRQRDAEPPPRQRVKCSSSPTGSALLSGWDVLRYIHIRYLIIRLFFRKCRLCLDSGCLCKRAPARDCGFFLLLSTTPFFL